MRYYRCVLNVFDFISFVMHSIQIFYSILLPFFLSLFYAVKLHKSLGTVSFFRMYKKINFCCGSLERDRRNKTSTCSYNAYLYRNLWLTVITLGGIILVFISILSQFFVLKPRRSGSPWSKEMGSLFFSLYHTPLIMHYNIFFITFDSPFVGLIIYLILFFTSICVYQTILGCSKSLYPFFHFQETLTERSISSVQDPACNTHIPLRRFKRNQRNFLMHAEL